MDTKKRIAALIAVAALAPAPAAAFAGGPEYHPEHPEHPAHPTPGPKASLPEKAKAYGVYCRNQPKKHKKGEKGTPFSQCVTAMAKVATAPETTTAKAACKELSKEHVKGQKRTPFANCVVAAAQVKKDLAAS
jgi:hypothetical protein